MAAGIYVNRPPALEAPAGLIERFLRDRESVWRQINHEYRLESLIRQMLLTSTLACAAYGAAMGISHSWIQAIASAIKLPLLFLLTLAICLPAFYLYNLFFGGRLSARQALALVLCAITITSVFTLSFAPITVFFLISAPGYHFFLLLNVAILALTGTLGLQFLVGGVNYINTLAVDEPVLAAEPDRVEQSGASEEAVSPRLLPARPPRPVNVELLRIWLVLYAFVGAQLGWTLRPFFGSHHMPFQLFRSIESNFYQSVIDTLIYLLR